jgi:hypothetical protein
VYTGNICGKQRQADHGPAQRFTGQEVFPGGVAAGMFSPVFYTAPQPNGYNACHIQNGYGKV